MKKQLLFISLIIILSATASVASMRMRGTILNKKPNGEAIKVEFFGGMIAAPGQDMSKALTRGRGQHMLANSDEVLELRTASEIFDITKKAITVKVSDGIKTFQITRGTKLCDLRDQRIRVKNLEVGEMVTILSGVDEKQALSIHEGPMFFTGAMHSAYKLENLDCTK